jgi:hypothetical protein
LPLTNREVDVQLAFEGTELLYRRASPGEINSAGELDPSQLESISFSKYVEGAPSVLRGAFAVAADAIAPECAGGKNVSDCSVFEIEVRELPVALKSGDGREFNFFPTHHPLADCGAHSVISCHLAGDADKRYVVPTRPVRNALRSKLATKMRRCVASSPSQTSTDPRTTEPTPG